jgi:hypothetical protein
MAEQVAEHAARLHTVEAVMERLCLAGRRFSR